ncbi:MAG: helical backbone metal receptor [Candidatus Hodarchaeales archaeon]|jgi:ABC-type Fe3+-hydroxamate transport system substrate-binding protein
MPFIDAIKQEIAFINPKRVVSLVPSITETLFAFELEELVIGVTDYCIFPKKAQKLPRKICGGTKNPDIDLISSLKPDLVIANKEENREKHIQKLLSSNIPVWVTYPLTINDSVVLLEHLVEVFGLEKNEKVTDFIHTLKIKIKSVLTDISDKKLLSNKVFCPIWKNPWMSINKRTYIHDMLTILGLQNITSEMETSRYPEVNLHQIITETKPDIILLPTEPYEFSENDILAIKKEYRSLKIEVPKKIVIVDGTYLSWYGVRTFTALNVLYDLIYPE